MKENRFVFDKALIDKILTVILLASIIVSICITVYIIITPKQGEKFTEFYILGPNGTASGYPTDLKVGDNGEVIIGIVNHEYENVSYLLEVKLDEKILESENVGLIHNETWESPFIFKAQDPGQDQKLEFLLYNNSSLNETVYRSLHFWMDVT